MLPSGPRPGTLGGASVDGRPTGTHLGNVRSGQGPDGHPVSTHEYLPGLRVLAHCLQDVDGLQAILVNADEPWEKGPELLDTADAVVLFLSEGAKWIHQDDARLEALQQLARRGGGFVGIHWGIGCKKARYIKNYVQLVGGCHGGPDRRYKVVSVQAKPAISKHPILRGIQPFQVKDEFYYRLKFAQPSGSVTPLLKVPVEGQTYPVAWAWERPDGGRSFGFSGCHFHRNWKLIEYRRLATQGVLWSLRVPIPKEGLSVSVSKNQLALPSRNRQ